MKKPESLTVPKTPTFTGTLGCNGSTPAAEAGGATAGPAPAAGAAAAAAELAVAASGAAADRVPGAVVGAEQPIRLESSARPTRAPIAPGRGTRSSRERLPGGCNMPASLVPAPRRG